MNYTLNGKLGLKLLKMFSTILNISFKNNRGPDKKCTIRSANQVFETPDIKEEDISTRNLLVHNKTVRFSRVARSKNNKKAKWQPCASVTKNLPSTKKWNKFLCRGDPIKEI